MALSYLEMDKWSADHASCEAEYRFVVELLNTRSYEPRTSKKYDLLSAKMRVQLKQLETNVTNLKQRLEDDFSLTHEEKERRFRMTEELESLMTQITQKINTRFGEAERSSLLGVGGSSSGAVRDLGETGWASDDDDTPTDSQPLLNTQDIRDQHSRLLQDQEEGLDRLSKVISRQKDIAVTIGNEVTLQNELVDNIADRMERTNTSIHRETDHIQVITRTDNTCGYWLVIIGLFIAIVVVGIL